MYLVTLTVTDNDGGVGTERITGKVRAGGGLLTARWTPAAGTSARGG